MLDNALVPEIDKGFERASLGNSFLERDLLRVVQVDELEFIEAKAHEAFFDGPADAVTGEVGAAGDRVNLRRDDVSLGDATALGDRPANPLFTGTPAVLV
ncbi:hypothetical protein D9M69_631370 [compost metagenome]